ncbi:flagellar biosynthesis protein FlhA [Paenibacillus macerans]|nr:flagellar biosynthesis protein FlhA [Paenibacillus macerans]
MIVPIPTLLLDILLIVNISLALIILLVAMNTKEALQFSIFPAMLLITTLFRLALNISTTKLILGQAKAGDVVATFGSWISQGQPVVGFVVFLILVVVQFIVITKGSERVAEVAARFTLDAMPGKQMSIDADLNAGLINEQQARERRSKIEREADFYGAMDGASKFVKGDAIASIVILLINLIGGFIIGMSIHGMPFGEALSTYSILTIGDGLVSQIPALLISTAAGLIVTRASSEGNLAEDITGQLFHYPKLLYIVAGTIAMLGLFTPIGIWTTFPFAGLMIFAAIRMQKNMNRKQIEQEQQEEEQQIEEVRSPESVINLLQVDPIEFEFGYGLIPLADTSQGGDLLDRIIMIRRQCALEMGLVVPVIRIRDNIQLKPNEYVIKIKGNVVGGGELLLNHYLAMSPGMDDESITGIETREPAFGLPALWIDETIKDRAELSGYTVVDPPSVVATHLTELIKKHAHELLGRQETKALVDNLKEHYAVLVDELIPSILTIGDVQKVLAKLLREKISIRDMVTIFETLADYGTYTKDPDVLTEYVRQACRARLRSSSARPAKRCGSLR